MLKSLSFFGDRFSIRAKKTDAQAAAMAWAEKTIAHMETPPRVYHLDGYIAVMSPQTGLGWSLAFVSPKGNRMAEASASSNFRTPDQLWEAHLDHFRKWVPEEKANPRD